MKTIAGIIHARKDSTRCPNKHLRQLGNTTLIDVALEKLSKLNVDEKLMELKYYIEITIQLHQVIAIIQFIINI